MPPESCLARLPVPVELAEGRARGCVHHHGSVGRRLVNTLPQSPKFSADKTVSAAVVFTVHQPARLRTLPTQHVNALPSCQTVRSATGAVGGSSISAAMLSATLAADVFTDSRARCA